MKAGRNFVQISKIVVCTFASAWVTRHISQESKDNIDRPWHTPFSSDTVGVGDLIPAKSGAKKSIGRRMEKLFHRNPYSAST
jgi:hypothetical protein